MTHLRRRQIDLDAFDRPFEKLETKYGLPRKVLFCKRCVISNQRPNSSVEYEHTKASRKVTIAFDADGICDACRAAEQKHNLIDWQSRERELNALCNRFRRDDGGYDCVVPGSGGKDSFYEACRVASKFL